MLALLLGRRAEKMEQWFLKITAYADELLSGHAQLGKWPEHVLAMQKNWIGRSEGAYLNFDVPSLGKSIRVFTTRLDTIFQGDVPRSFARSIPWSAIWSGAPGGRASRLACQDDRRRPGQAEIGEAEKEGVDTGVTAVNPFSANPSRFGWPITS